MVKGCLLSNPVNGGAGAVVPFPCPKLQSQAGQRRYKPSTDAARESARMAIAGPLESHPYVARILPSPWHLRLHLRRGVPGRRKLRLRGGDQGQSAGPDFAVSKQHASRRPPRLEAGRVGPLELAFDRRDCDPLLADAEPAGRLRIGASITAVLIPEQRGSSI